MGTWSNYMKGFVKSSRWYNGKRPTHLPLEYRMICKIKYHNITYHNHQTNIHLTSCVAKQLACLFGSLLRILKASVLKTSHWSNQSVYLATASLEESCVVVRHFCPGNIKWEWGEIWDPANRCNSQMFNIAKNLNLWFMVFVSPKRGTWIPSHICSCSCAWLAE